MSLKGVFLALLNLTLGTLVGLVALEAVLRMNPALLFRGMALPAPADLPLTVSEYGVRYSDGDLFYWHANLIRSIDQKDDRLEANVRFQTDEFGFPNPAPLPQRVDVVVLGRSYSLGAQVSSPWPRLLAEKTGLRVLNLSQAGSGIDTKASYLRRYGLPRQPRWVIVEVLPSMDIVEYDKAAPWLVEMTPFPVLQWMGRKLVRGQQSSTGKNPIYPMALKIGDDTTEVTFFSHYLSSLTIDQTELEDSWQWQQYQQGLLALVNEANEKAACVLLLYVPTKENIYFSLADRRSLGAALYGWSPWILDASGFLEVSNTSQAEISNMKSNALASRAAVARFARQQGLPLIDPTQEIMQAAENGEEPFMTYDSHWSQLGQQLVEAETARILQSASCP